MSLEKQRDTKAPKKKKLEDSSFRQDDFRPIIVKTVLQEELNEKDEEKELEPIPIIEKELENNIVKEKEVLEYIPEPPEELTLIEQDILEIAEKILKLKRYEAEFDLEQVDSEAYIQKFPIIEKLYAKCIAKLSYSKGYSKDDIFLAIRKLEEKNYIVTNERRTKLEILSDERFQNILDFIKMNPGIHARDDKIEKSLGITRTPFLKHIMTLERFKLIRSKKEGKTLHYFLVDVPEDYDLYKMIFLNPLIPQILEEFFKNEEVSISLIGEILAIYSGTIQYHVKKLKELNLIKSIKNQLGKKIHLVNIELLKKYNEFFGEPDFSNLLKGL